MDWLKFWTEFWRIARIVASNVAGSFAALTAVGKSITGNAVYDIIIFGVLNAIAFGTSRASDGKSMVPGMPSKGGTPPAGGAPAAGVLFIVLSAAALCMLVARLGGGPVL